MHGDEQQRQGQFPTFLEARDISKSFGGTHALRNFDLDVRRGEIHGIVGANGSGKSTFIKILAGVVRADAGGSIRVGGTDASASAFHDPAVARAAGIRFVHQDPCVFPELTVAENFALGSSFPTTRGGRVRWRALRSRTSEVLHRFQLDIDPDAPIHTLRSADRTMVAVARALQDVESEEEALLVLDEPTAALPQEDVDLLFESLRMCASRGQTILLVNHRLREVLAVADTVTVLRDGSRVATSPSASLDQAELAELIVGRPLTNAHHTTQPTAAGPAEARTVLEVRDLHGRGVRGVSFTARSGEILGIAGLRGDGQTEMLQMIFGDRRRSHGEIVLNGSPVHFAHPRDAMDAGVAYLPPNRIEEAVFPDLSVLTNLTAGTIADYWRRLVISRKRERADGQRLVPDFRVKLQSLDEPISNLSGGNQQKVMFARWLQREPTVLLLEEPSQGVDIGAHLDIEALVRDFVTHDRAVVIVSSDLSELARLCDRVGIMRDGHISDMLQQPFDETELTRRMIRRGVAA